MIQRVILLCSVLFLTACATGMYSAPDADSAAVVTVENLLSKEVEQQNTAGGWTMPSMNVPARTGLFTVDGDRLDEQGGDQRALLTPGRHQIQIFADDKGVLRFKKFSLKVKEGHEYVVRVMGHEGADRYRAEVVDTAAPDEIIKEVTF